MTEFQRYAVYYTPRPGPFADFGARWLGWDIATGTTRGQTELPCDDIAIENITRTPRKYGFHGTLKPPFRLKEGQSINGLRAAIARLCAAQNAVRCAGLELNQIASFLALTPVGDTRALAELAAAIVQELDPFRAPASEAELAKRRKAGLTARQDENLLAWGYPYVLEEFRFHLTLTGSLKRAWDTPVKAHLTEMLSQVPLAPFEVPDLTLVGEAYDGRFHEIERFALAVK
ncbi:DUF1045 domain-containing protein [Cognatishimia sp. SS12]|uniref:DUF1045 domain-containing protein n=1 Tax=Cognatishimia sp. SS12 TaxID=2979465 RepID=UPI00232AB446|nr:DUF1045 domain-containing protein [Cognatishimia sp. SS12]MDC0738447.1 DUF1045 domain-containing protein [Cognatishimia sp. SS12]